jgi:hypothetical protein
LGPRERAPLALEDRIRTRDDIISIFWLEHNRRGVNKFVGIFGNLLGFMDL